MVDLIEQDILKPQMEWSKNKYDKQKLINGYVLFIYAVPS